tara:strand:- start:3507 stop:3743 length:237 start_codon:yes stop_codon:yes gene_type:complete
MAWFKKRKILGLTSDSNIRDLRVCIGKLTTMLEKVNKDLGKKSNGNKEKLALLRERKNILDNLETVRGWAARNQGRAA